MKTRDELTLDFMLAMAGSSETLRVLRASKSTEDEDEFILGLYGTALAMANTYLSQQ